MTAKHHTPEYREYQRKWRQRNRLKTREYGARYRNSHRELVRRKTRERKRQVRREEKQRCIEAYGGKCTCCDETEILFLTIDHTKNNGVAHRKEIRLPNGGTGYMFYKWLREHNYPKRGYQVMCFNCNCGKQLNGGVCPHKRKR